MAVLTKRRISEIVKIIVDNAPVERIYIFGSYADGTADGDSDLDILVIAPSDLPRWRRTPVLYEALAGQGVPKDIIWWTPEEFEETSRIKSHLASKISQKGKLVYEHS